MAKKRNDKRRYLLNQLNIYIVCFKIFLYEGIGMKSKYKGSDLSRDVRSCLSVNSVICQSVWEFLKAVDLF